MPPFIVLLRGLQASAWPRNNKRFGTDQSGCDVSPVVRACAWLDLLPGRKRETQQPARQCLGKYPVGVGIGSRWPSAERALCRGRGGWRVRRGDVSNRWRTEQE